MPRPARSAWVEGQSEKEFDSVAIAGGNTVTVGTPASVPGQPVPLCQQSKASHREFMSRLPRLKDACSRFMRCPWPDEFDSGSDSDSDSNDTCINLMGRVRRKAALAAENRSDLISSDREIDGSNRLCGKVAWSEERGLEIVSSSRAAIDVLASAQDQRLPGRKRAQRKSPSRFHDTRSRFVRRPWSDEFDSGSDSHTDSIDKDINPMSRTLPGKATMIAETRGGVIGGDRVADGSNRLCGKVAWSEERGLEIVSSSRAAIDVLASAQDQRLPGRKRAQRKSLSRHLCVHDTRSRFVRRPWPDTCDSSSDSDSESIVEAMDKILRGGMGSSVSSASPLSTATSYNFDLSGGMGDTSPQFASGFGTSLGSTKMQPAISDKW